MEIFLIVICVGNVFDTYQLSDDTIGDVTPNAIEDPTEIRDLK